MDLPVLPLKNGQLSDIMNAQEMSWNLLPPVEDFLWKSTNKHHKQSTTGQLIVCATLVGSLPNLGKYLRAGVKSGLYFDNSLG